MSESPAKQYERILSDMFADVLGFTRDNWNEIEEIAEQVRSSGIFKADQTKCLIAGFVIWFESIGYIEDDRIPDDGRH